MERLALHICFRAQGFRWPLHDDYDVEVWTASSHQLVATLPGRLIRHLVELHLAGAIVQREIQPLVRPLAKLPQRFDPQHRTQLRLKRRSRRASS